MRPFILFALACATIAITALVDASKKSATPLSLGHTLLVRHRKKLNDLPDSVILNDSLDRIDSIRSVGVRQTDHADRKTGADLETAVHKKPLRRLRRRRYEKKVKIVKKKVTKKVKKKVTKKVKKATKKVKKTAKKVKKVTKKVKKVTTKHHSSVYLNPQPNKRRRRRRRRQPYGPKVCPCRVVAKPAKECYAFTNEDKGLCQLGMCGAKWECVTNRRAKYLCMRKFATEVIELRPGSYTKCRRRTHRKKPFWVYHRTLPKPSRKRSYKKKKDEEKE